MNDCNLQNIFTQDLFSDIRNVINYYFNKYENNRILIN